MNILDEIKAYKQQEVAERKAKFPVKQLEKSSHFPVDCFSLKAALNLPDASGIIAEFKRKSPSKGDINKPADVEIVTSGYIKSEATALSVLTDTHFFGGSSNDLLIARKINACPILRKDFIIDEYQLVESKAMGADVILLIVKMLTLKQVKELAKQARLLGLETLLEIHEEKELSYLNEDIDLVGINNRNLNSFQVDIETANKLGRLIPGSFTKIAESGISSAQDILYFRNAGFKGFLIGEYFMKNNNPALACAKIIQELKLIEIEPKL